MSGAKPRSYTVLTSGTTYSGSIRPDTRVDGVLEVAFDDGLLAMHGKDGLLFASPLSQVVYVKEVEPRSGNSANSTSTTYTISASALNVDAEAIHAALLKLKRDKGDLGLA